MVRVTVTNTGSSSSSSSSKKNTVKPGEGVYYELGGGNEVYTRGEGDSFQKVTDLTKEQAAQQVAGSNARRAQAAKAEAARQAAIEAEQQKQAAQQSQAEEIKKSIASEEAKQKVQNIEQSQRTRELFNQGQSYYNPFVTAYKEKQESKIQSRAIDTSNLYELSKGEVSRGKKVAAMAITPFGGALVGDYFAEEEGLISYEEAAKASTIAAKQEYQAQEQMYIDTRNRKIIEEEQANLKARAGYYQNAIDIGEVDYDQISKAYNRDIETANQRVAFTQEELSKDFYETKGKFILNQGAVTSEGYTVRGEIDTSIKAVPSEFAKGFGTGAAFGGGLTAVSIVSPAVGIGSGVALGVAGAGVAAYSVGKGVYTGFKSYDIYTEAGFSKKSAKLYSIAKGTNAVAPIAFTSLGAVAGGYTGSKVVKGGYNLYKTGRAAGYTEEELAIERKILSRENKFKYELVEGQIKEVKITKGSKVGTGTSSELKYRVKLDTTGFSERELAFAKKYNFRGIEYDTTIATQGKISGSSKVIFKTGSSFFPKTTVGTGSFEGIPSGQNFQGVFKGFSFSKGTTGYSEYVLKGTGTTKYSNGKIIRTDITDVNALKAGELSFKFVKGEPYIGTGRGLFKFGGESIRVNSYDVLPTITNIKAGSISLINPKLSGTFGPTSVRTYEIKTSLSKEGITTPSVIDIGKAPTSRVYKTGGQVLQQDLIQLPSFQTGELYSIQQTTPVSSTVQTPFILPQRTQIKETKPITTTKLNFGRVFFKPQVQELKEQSKPIISQTVFPRTKTGIKQSDMVLVDTKPLQKQQPILKEAPITKPSVPFVPRVPSFQRTSNINQGFSKGFGLPPIPLNFGERGFTLGGVGKGFKGQYAPSLSAIGLGIKSTSIPKSYSKGFGSLTIRPIIEPKKKKNKRRKK